MRNDFVDTTLFRYCRALLVTAYFLVLIKANDMDKPTQRYWLTPWSTHDFAGVASMPYPAKQRSA